jgi:hypothetical protein
MYFPQILNQVLVLWYMLREFSILQRRIITEPYIFTNINTHEKPRI